MLVNQYDKQYVTEIILLIIWGPKISKLSYRLEQAFSESLHRHFPVVNTRLTISVSAVEAAKKLLNEKQINDPNLIQLLNKAVEKENAISDKAVRVYNEVIDELVNIAENCNGWVFFLFLLKLEYQLTLIIL